MYCTWSPAAQLILVVLGTGGCGGLASSFYVLDDPPPTDIPVYVDALDRALQSVNQSISAKNSSNILNLLTGLFFSEVHLTHAIRHLDEKHLPDFAKDSLSDLLRTCQLLRKRLQRKRRGNSHFNSLSSLVQNIKPWVSSESPQIRRGQLTRWLPQTGETRRPALLGFNDIIMDWEMFVEIADSPTLTPDEDQSDHCLLELSRAPAKSNLQKCNISQYCHDIMLQGLTVGYPLTHRFLYLLLSITAKKCYHISALADQILMDVTCAMLFLEANYIAKNDFPHPDLFMEMVGLCSLRGYQEFGQSRWIRRVLSWQLPGGCFPAFPSDFSCYHHATSVGMINLAFGIRYGIHLVRY